MRNIETCSAGREYSGNWSLNRDVISIQCRETGETGETRETRKLDFVLSKSDWRRRNICNFCNCCNCCKHGECGRFFGETATLVSIFRASRSTIHVYAFSQGNSISLQQLTWTLVWLNFNRKLDLTAIALSGFPDGQTSAVRIWRTLGHEGHEDISTRGCGQHQGHQGHKGHEGHEGHENMRTLPQEDAKNEP